MSTQTRWTRAAGWALTTAAATIATACGATSTPAAARTAEPAVATQPPAGLRVTVAGGCPAQLGGARDVTNSGAGLDHQMTPADPTAGVICRYHPSGALYRQTPLNEKDAQQLAAAADQISSATPTGTYHCPADFGSGSVIAFAYPGRPDVDLWYHDTGCQTLDNGHLRVYQAGNPSFSDGFGSMVDRMSPPSSGG